MGRDRGGGRETEGRESGGRREGEKKREKHGLVASHRYRYRGWGYNLKQIGALDQESLSNTGKGHFFFSFLF